MGCEQNTDIRLKDDCYVSKSRVQFISPGQLECFFLWKKHQYLPTRPCVDRVCRPDGLLV
jgi:hypothetical protein